MTTSTPTLLRTPAGAPLSTLPKLGSYRRSKVRKLRVAQGIPRRVPIDRSHAHVLWLFNMGFTYHSIAAAAGVGLSTVRQIALRRFETVQIETARAVLSTTHKPVAAQACLTVPSIGTVRRLRALNAIGWTNKALGTVLGVSATAVGHTSNRDCVTYETWASIAEMYERLSGTPGCSALSRSRAKDKGYAPPIAWDGTDMDHPDAAPAVAAEDSSGADRVLVERILAGRHRGPIEKPERLAILDHAIERSWTSSQVAPLLRLSKVATDQALVRRRKTLRSTEAVDLAV